MDKSTMLHGGSRCHHVLVACIVAAVVLSVIAFPRLYWVAGCTLVCAAMVSILARTCFSESNKEGFVETPKPVLKGLMPGLPLGLPSRHMKGPQPQPQGHPHVLKSLHGDKPVSHEGVVQPTSTLLLGMVVHVTCFDPASYVPANGKTWQNTANVVVAKNKDDQTACVHGKRDFMFSKSPTFSNKDGFTLGPNAITGPYSHELGVRCDQAMSIVTMVQLTGDLPAEGSPEVSVFKLFANTPNNNGLTLTIGGGTRIDGLIKGKLRLQLGNRAAIPCDKNGAYTVFDPTHHYVIAVVKDYGKLKVLLVDIDMDTYDRKVLLDTIVGPQDGNIALSNVDMTINQGGNWNGRIFTFVMYSKALDDRDVTHFYDMYKTQFLEFDPAYQDMKRRLDDATKIKSCPFDATTCASCGGTKDWTNFGDMAGSGTSCLRAIDRYCTLNPSHAKCSCWSTSNPEYGTSCMAYRSAFDSRHDRRTQPTSNRKTPHHSTNRSADIDKLIETVERQQRVIDAQLVRAREADDDAASTASSSTSSGSSSSDDDNNNDKNKHGKRKGTRKGKHDDPQMEEARRRLQKKRNNDAGFWSTVFGW